MRTDYSEEILALLQANYEPIRQVEEEDYRTEKKKLQELYEEVTNILPATWITEADVYDALQELGFRSFMYTWPAETDKAGTETKKERQELLYLLQRKV